MQNFSKYYCVSINEKPSHEKCIDECCMRRISLLFTKMFQGKTSALIDDSLLQNQ